MEKVKAFADWLTKWFTVIVIVWAVFNYFVPAASLWGKAYTGYMLGIVLFGMGLTLTLDDFKSRIWNPSIHRPEDHDRLVALLKAIYNEA